MASNRSNVVPLYDEEDDLGPKMQALTVLQRNFVLAITDRTTKNHSAAMRAAGYEGVAGDERSRTMARNPKVQEAMLEEGKRQLKGMVPDALAELWAILINPQIDPNVRLKAILAVLDRTGIASVQEKKLTVEHIGQDASLLSRIETLATGLGIDAKLLLGSRVKRGPFGRPLKPSPSDPREAATDVEYEEVPYSSAEDLL
jgi:hypothetical protein